MTPFKVDDSTELGAQFIATVPPTGRIEVHFYGECDNAVIDRLLDLIDRAVERERQR